MLRSDNSEARRAAMVFIVLTACLLVGGAMLVYFDDRGGREDAEELVWDECVERFGGEAQCEERLDLHHSRCHALNYQPPRRSRAASRDIRKGFDQEGYLDCLELSPEAWKAERIRNPKQIPNFPKVHPR